MFSEYRRRSTYCDPDNFGMYIYNDFNGWGLQELMENLVRQCASPYKIKLVPIINRCLRLTQLSRRKTTTISSACGQ
jgi:hypothetical protein